MAAIKMPSASTAAAGVPQCVLQQVLERNRSQVLNVNLSRKLSGQNALQPLLQVALPKLLNGSSIRWCTRMREKQVQMQFPKMSLQELKMWNAAATGGKAEVPVAAAIQKRN